MEHQIPELCGNNNKEKVEADGIFLKIVPDEDFLKVISENIKQENAVFPFEYYKFFF